MNRKVFAGILCLMLLLWCVGCGKNKRGITDQGSSYSNELKGAPDWVRTGGGNMEGGNAAVGIAKIGAAGMSFAKDEALANARDELSRQLETRVSNLFKNFTQQIGVGDDQTVDKMASNVSKQVSKQAISGSHQKDMWISKTDTAYVLVVVNPDIIKNALKQSVQTSMQNEKAMWQQFQAKKGFEELEKEIDKEFGDFKN